MCEGGYILCLLTFHLLCHCPSPFVREVLYELCLLIRAQYEVDPIDVSNTFWRKLGIASCHHDKGMRVITYHLVYLLPAFMVGDFCDGACVHKTYISFFILSRLYDTEL